ncbi:hypothetical protein ACWCXX_36270 [Streptomyces sp. NPDC001732]
MKAIGSRPEVLVSADGSVVVGHAGARLLADPADATGLTSACSTVLWPVRPRGTGHEPGRAAVDLAVMIADGGETITDLAVLRDQAGVFGPTVSTATARRLLAESDDTVLARGAGRKGIWTVTEMPPTDLGCSWADVVALAEREGTPVLEDVPARDDVQKAGGDGD